MLSDVTDLPEPDSPTTAKHLAAVDVERHAVDRPDEAVVGVRTSCAGLHRQEHLGGLAGA